MRYPTYLDYFETYRNLVLDYAATGADQLHQRRVRYPTYLDYFEPTATWCWARVATACSDSCWASATR